MALWHGHAWQLTTLVTSFEKNRKSQSWKLISQECICCDSDDKRRKVCAGVGKAWPRIIWISVQELTLKESDEVNVGKS